MKRIRAGASQLNGYQVYSSALQPKSGSFAISAIAPLASVILLAAALPAAIKKEK